MAMDRKVFFNAIRAEPFGGFLSGSQVSGISAILDCWDRVGQADPRWLAYALATTLHETARTMQPIEEYGKGKGHPYGLPTGPWHQVYDGRGDVQLTFLGNYQKATTRLQALGLIDKTTDLAKTPDLAMIPAIAANILIIGMVEGWFTGSALSHWFSATVDDPVNARRIINGTDKADLIAGYHRQFRAAIKAAAPAGTIALTPNAPVLDGIEAAINRAADASNRPGEPARPVLPPPIPSPGPLRTAPYSPPAVAGPHQVPAVARPGFWGWFKATFGRKVA